MNSYWQKSQCLNGYLHDFKLYRQFPACSEEICEKCHKRKFFRVANGRVKNTEYLAWHLRDALQKYHNIYEREYKKEQ